MAEVEGARTFAVDGAAYDSFMGRYAVELAEPFADAAGVMPGGTALDVGCGPGALTAALVARLGAKSVCAVDPSPTFRDECAARNPGVVVRLGRAEAIPFDDSSFDQALAQLVLHFVSEPDLAVREMTRVVRAGGTLAACVWDFDGGMELLRGFWDAAQELDPDAPDEARTMRFGRPGEIAELFAAAGVRDVVESTLRVTSTYASFDELWAGFLAGVGPAGAYCASLAAVERARLRDALRDRFGAASGSFALGAVARCAVGWSPE